MCVVVRKCPCKNFGTKSYKHDERRCIRVRGSIRCITGLMWHVESRYHLLAALRSTDRGKCTHPLVNTFTLLAPFKLHITKQNALSKCCNIAACSVCSGFVTMCQFAWNYMLICTKSKKHAYTICILALQEEWELVHSGRYSVQWHL